MQILLRVDRQLLLCLSIDWVCHHLTPLPNHCSSLLLLKLLMLHPNYSRVAWIWVNRCLRGILISVGNFWIWKLSQRLRLIGLLLLESAGIVILFGLIGSILDSHLLLAALVSFGGSNWLFCLNFLLILLLVIVYHISEKWRILMTTKKITLGDFSDMSSLPISWGILSLLWNLKFDCNLIAKKWWSLILLLRHSLNGLRLFNFILFIILLLKLGHESLLNVAKMWVLKPCQLLQLMWPNWIDIALFSRGTGNWAGNQVLISVDQLMVLQT